MVGLTIGNIRVNYKGMGTNSMFTYIFLLFLLTCGIQQDLTAANEKNAINSSMDAIQMAMTLGSYGIQTVKLAGSTVQWAYQNPCKTAAIGGITGSTSLYACYKVSSKLMGTGSKVCGIALAGFMLYNYLSNQELQHLVIDGTNAILATLKQIDEKIDAFFKWAADKFENINQTIEEIKNMIVLGNEQSKLQAKIQLQAIDDSTAEIKKMLEEQEKRQTLRFILYAKAAGLQNFNLEGMSEFCPEKSGSSEEMKGLLEQLAILEKQTEELKQKLAEKNDAQAPIKLEPTVVPEFRPKTGIVNRLTSWWTGPTDKPAEEEAPPIVSPFIEF